jgi:hypothetical protein
MFRSRLTGPALGALVYEELRMEVAGDGVLSLGRLVERLRDVSAPAHAQSAGEVMIACMFSATLAAGQVDAPGLPGDFRSGLETEFIRHLREQGAGEEQVEEWRVVLAEHFAEYYRTMDTHAGAALPAMLGREFLWNLTGEEITIPVCDNICTSYMTAARAVAARVIARHLPRLRPAT